MTDGQEHSVEIDGHDFPPVLERGLDQWSCGGDAGVGYYDVQSAELVDRSGDEILDLLFVGNVGGDSDRPVDRVRHCLCCVTVDVGDYDAGTFQAFGELGYRIETGFASFEPFAGLAYVSLDTSAFGETGGAAALTTSGAGMDTTFSTLGIRLAKEVNIGSLAATLRGTVGWQHALSDVTPRATQAFLGSIPFTVTGVPLAEDAALIEAGLNLTLTEATTLGLAYAGQFGDSTTQNSVNATLKVSF